ARLRLPLALPPEARVRANARGVRLRQAWPPRRRARHARPARAHPARPRARRTLDAGADHLGKRRVAAAPPEARLQRRRRRTRGRLQARPLARRDGAAAPALAFERFVRGVSGPAFARALGARPPG